uniref:Uncharacterized protein n=1 Tax=Sphaeramia orbicularis TaxID=375764 RepID=A0A672ZL75_9TELE
MQKCTMGIYVIRVISLDSYHLGSEAQACAVMHGVIYELNLAYPKELRHYYELNQMDEEKLFQASDKIILCKNLTKQNYVCSTKHFFQCTINKPFVYKQSQ